MFRAAIVASLLVSGFVLAAAQPARAERCPKSTHEVDPDVMLLGPVDENSRYALKAALSQHRGTRSRYPLQAGTSGTLVVGGQRHVVHRWISHHEHDGMHGGYEVALLERDGHIVAAAMQAYHQVFDHESTLVRNLRTVADLDRDGRTDLCIRSAEYLAPGLFEGRRKRLARMMTFRAYRWDRRCGRLVRAPRLDRRCPKTGYRLFAGRPKELCGP